MSRNDRTHLINDAVPVRDDTNTPKHLSRQEFGRRVYQAMLAKGWRQADLARQAGLGKESVSAYINGKSTPSPLNVQKLAEALGKTVEDLLPNQDIDAIANDHPDFELRTSPSDPTKAWVRLNRLMSLDAAVRIAAIANEDLPKGR